MSISNPIRLAVIGAGNRANKYLRYCEEHPERLQLTALSEINVLRREACAARFGLSPEACFEDYRTMLDRCHDIDMVLVTTPDNLHFDPVMRAIAARHHVLIEKPIAQTPEEGLRIREAARREGVRVGVCHVLRFHPYFQKIKELVAEGRYGEVISINHSISVGMDRSTHSFVRGIFSDSDTSNPMLISKCCHDVDFLLWVADRKCLRVASFGSLKWFRAENAPAQSTERCITCPLEEQCPYSARDLYQRRRDWISNFDIPAGGSIDDAIRHELVEGPYGRCVFRCRNNVVDHQCVILDMEHGASITLTMDMFTTDDLRRTTIHLSHGEIYGDERRIVARDFKGREQVFDFSAELDRPYHAGADLRLIGDFTEAILCGDHPLTVSADDLWESFLVCHAAEQSRLRGQVIRIDDRQTRI